MARHELAEHIAAREWHDRRRVHRVAAGIEHRGMAIRDCVVHRPGIAGRHDDAFGERAGAIDADDRGFAAEMRAPGLLMIRRLTFG